MNPSVEHMNLCAELKQCLSAQPLRALGRQSELLNVNYPWEKIDDLKKVINGKYQTITYFGVTKSKLTTFANKLETDGISRIVPIGQAIDMDIIWDGKNLITGF